MSYDPYSIGIVDYIVGRIASEIVVDAIFRFPEDSTFVQKMNCGVVYYTKNKNHYIESFKNVKFNRRLETKRIMTHTKK